MVATYLNWYEVLSLHKVAIQQSMLHMQCAICPIQPILRCSAYNQRWITVADYGCASNSNRIILRVNLWISIGRWFDFLQLDKRIQCSQILTAPMQLKRICVFKLFQSAYHSNNGSICINQATHAEMLFYWILFTRNTSWTTGSRCTAIFCSLRLIEWPQQV